MLNATKKPHKEKRISLCGFYFGLNVFKIKLYREFGYKKSVPQSALYQRNLFRRNKKSEPDDSI